MSYIKIEDFLTEKIPNIVFTTKDGFIYANETKLGPSAECEEDINSYNKCDSEKEIVEMIKLEIRINNMKNNLEVFKGFEVSDSVIDPLTFESRVEVKSDGVRIARISLEGLQDSLTLYGKETIADIFKRILS